MPTNWFIPMSQTRGVRVALVGASYAGATLVLGATAIAVGVYGPGWTDATAASLLSALAVVSAGGGLAVAGGSRGLAAHRIGLTSVRHHVGGLLFAVAAVSIGAAAGVFANAHQWFAGSAVGLVAAMLGYALLPRVSGVLAVSALSVGLAVSTAAELTGPGPLTVGAALVAVGALLCLVSAVGPARHAELGVSVGALVALAGAQAPLAEPEAAGWAYGLSLAVAVASFVLFRELPAVTLLVVGTVGLALAVLEATWNLTSGPAGLVATLAATGGTLMVAAAIGMRLWQARGFAMPPEPGPPPPAARRVEVPTRPIPRPLAAYGSRRPSESSDSPRSVPLALAGGRTRTDA